MSISLEAPVGARRFGTELPGRLAGLAPGLLLACTVAAAAAFASQKTGAPPLLSALTIGMVLSSLGADPRCRAGILFASRTLLRSAVVVLGLTIGLADLSMIGWTGAALTVGALAATLVFGLGLGRLLGLSARDGAISAAAVAICGAAAAGAVATSLSDDEDQGQRAGVVVAWISIIGFVAMWAYPILAQQAGFDARQTAIFLGATIHELAQVVGAGYGVSEPVGQMATAVKLLRVACLAPVIAALVFLICRRTAPTAASAATAPPAVPWFIAGFVAAVLVANLGVLPAHADKLAAPAARSMMLVAFAAIGLGLPFAKLMRVPVRLLVAMVASTLFLAAGVACVVAFL